jgi:hypothetical protein
MGIAPGDLVSVFDIRLGKMLGVVVSTETRPGHFHDAPGRLQSISCTVLWNQETPSWMERRGQGNISVVPDTMLTIVK